MFCFDYCATSEVAYTLPCKIAYDAYDRDFVTATKPDTIETALVKGSCMVDTLQSLRKAHGLTLMELSRLTGISDGRLSNWEAWHRVPRSKSARDPQLMSVKSARLLADALGVSLDVLVNALSVDDDE